MYWAGFFNLIIHSREFFERLQNLWYRSTHSCTNIWIWRYFGLKNWTLSLAVPFSDVKTLKKHLFLLFFFMNCQWVFECARKQRGYFPFALSLLFLSSCLFCAHAPATQAIQASYIMLHFDVSFRSTWIEEFGIHPGTRVIYFLNTHVLLWDVAQ